MGDTRPDVSEAALALRGRVFDEMTDAILVADDERRYVDANAAACALLGRTREEILSLRVEDIMPAGGDVDALWRAFLAEGHQSGEVVIARGDEQLIVEYRARTHIAPSLHLSVLRDVTSRVKAAEAAERVSAMLDELLMASPVGFAYLDRETRFQLVNPVLAQMNGVPVEAHLGKTPMELLPGLSAEFIRSTVKTVLETGKPLVNLELVGETPAAPGATRTWLEHWFPVSVHGEIVGVGAIVNEVTEQRRAAAQLRMAAEQRQRLMAIVSHDLRNPLSAITTAAELIARNEEAPAQVHRLSGRILGASQRMVRLVNQLLDFARIDQGGGIALERTAMDLAAVARVAVEEMSLAFPDAVVRIDRMGDTAGHWDEDRIFQVLSNLLGNAVQHGDGTVQLTIDGSDAARVRMDVCNTGSPIAPELLEVIFDPFRRAAGGIARRAGLGLGLFITRSLVDAHGGTIVARSDANETCFTVTLPRR